MNDLLLDTHALVWFIEGRPLSATAKDAIDRTWRAGRDVNVSPISAWEIGMLTAKGRMAFAVTPAQWLARTLAQTGVRLAEMGPDILLEASYLPAPLHRDPADRILAATARAMNFTLVTRDRQLLAYAQAGHLRAVAC